MMTVSKNHFKLLFFYLLFGFLKAGAQQQLPDSMKRKIMEAKTPQHKFNVLHAAANFYIEVNNLDQIGETGRQELVLAQTLKAIP